MKLGIDVLSVVQVHIVQQVKRKPRVCSELLTKPGIDVLSVVQVYNKLSVNHGYALNY